MKLISRSALLIIIVIGLAATVRAEYTETMDPNGPTKNLGSDYGLVDDNAQENQSDLFQKAIDDIAASGGGRLIVPKGTYRLAEITLKSNVHLLIEKDTVIKPYWPEGTKVVVFNLDAEVPARKKQMTLEQKQAFIENVSIRGLGGRWIVDYSDREYNENEGARAIVGRMVRNFLIADLDVRDNYTIYCGITLSPMQTSEDVSGWAVSRATDGTVRNCRMFNASPGYGLVQLHGAQTVDFEDLYSLGGVTLRLETGAVGEQTAVFDITGKNVVGENGRCALMLGPHSAANGVVRFENIETKSCGYAVQISGPHVKKKELARNPDAKPGSFAKGSSVKNVHAVFGMTAQVKSFDLPIIPEEYHDGLDLKWEGKFYEAPSVGAISDTSGDDYDVKIENVTMEGFKYHADTPILTDANTSTDGWGEVFRKWKSDHGIEDEAGEKEKKSKGKTRKEGKEKQDKKGRQKQVK